MQPKAIVTMPPYAPFIDEVIKHPSVEGIRLNTVMPVKGSLEDVVKRMHDKTAERGKDLWIDLKGRQLRVDGFFVPPYTEIRLSHEIIVDTPTKAYFRNGSIEATVAEVDGNRLIMLDGPRMMLGPGESVNIPDESLVISGYLTDRDKQYIDACMKIGNKNYMLSFVESADDVKQLLGYDQDAFVAAKIESRKGMDYVKKEWKNEARLMAARGDLFIEVGMPHEIIDAVETIVRKDPRAIIASRILAGLANSLEPSCEDIGDVDNLMRMGYRTFMFGDEICQRRESIISGLNLFQRMADRYK